MKLLLPLALATLLAGPATAQTQLVGDITGAGTRTIEYHYTRQAADRTDTIRLVNGHFAQTVPAGDDGMGTLVFRLASGYIVSAFWAEPGKVHVQGTMEQLTELAATGTPENDVLNQYNHAVLWKLHPLPGKSEADYCALEAERAKATRQFVQAHPATRTSAYLLNGEMHSQADCPAADYAKLLQALTPAVRQSWYGQQAAKYLEVLQNQPTVGRLVPNFTMADTAGTLHSLATYRGQYVLLDFWGHWCHPCIQAMPAVNALHQQYAGKLAIIGVALESASSAGLWKKAIRQYQVPGLQLSELQATDGPMLTSYNIHAFPTYMLLDASGKLLYRTSDVEELKARLAQEKAL